ncbi:MAG: DMT family transporter [Anaerobiospirillum sp.]|nr:DMT family transporter [Anaerobiospirillum sp.]
MAQAKYYLLLLTVCLIWGATPASGKFTVEAFSPLMITGMRLALVWALLLLWLLILRYKKSLTPGRGVVVVCFFMGFMGMLVHNGLLFLGLNYTTATNTALIESIGPTATTVLAFIFLGERLNRFGWLGIVISCVGAVCIVAKGSLEVILNLSFNIGDVIILFAEIAWSAYVVISWQIHGRLGTIAVTAWSGLFGSLQCFLVGLVTGSLHVYTVTPQALLGFGYLVIFSGLFAFVAWNYAVQYVGASKAGVFVYLVPLTGGIVGVVFLGEALHPAVVIGAILILSGVILTVRSKVQLQNQKQAQIAEATDGQGHDLLKRFSDLAERHNANLAARGVELPEGAVLPDGHPLKQEDSAPVAEPDSSTQPAESSANAAPVQAEKTCAEESAAVSSQKVASAESPATGTENPAANSK